MQSQKIEVAGKRPLLRQLLIAGAALLLGGGAYFFLWRSPTPSLSSTQPPAAPRIETVTALGYLEPRGEVIKLSAPSSGGGTNRVEQLLVERGETVKAGQVVAILDNRERLQVALVQAEKQLAVSRSNLAVVQAGAKTGDIDARKFEVARIKAQLQGEERAQQETVARLQAQLEGDEAAQTTNVLRLEAELNNALSEFTRFRQLYQEGAISESIYDSKRLPTQTIAQQLNEAEANLKRTSTTGRRQLQEAKIVLAKIQATSGEQINAANATLDGIAEVRPVDVEAAQAQVDQAIAAVEQAQAQLNLATVRAPKGGIVLEIHTHPGELVSNEGIVELGQTEQMMALLEVYQTDIGKVKLGQSVKLSAEGLSDEISGNVVEIGVQVKRQNVINSDTSANIDARVVQVRVKLAAAATQKVAGLTNLQVTGEIEQ